MGLLTHDQACGLFSYDPVTGELRWKVQRGRVKVGERAGANDAKGYLIVRAYDRIYKVHRVIWLITNGQWPTGEIDHINGVKNDNRIVNLRDVSHAVNNQNQHRAMRSNKSCGLLGVTFDRSTPRVVRRWIAKITVNGKAYHIGRYDTPEEAHAAYLRKKASVLAGA